MLSKTSIKRPVTTMMIMFIALLAGFISLSTLKLDLMPSMNIPIAVVSTTYVGAGPEEIETLVTKPIEEALGSVSNVDTISSTSSSNSSVVMIQFTDGTDVDMAAIDMREKIDLIKSTLPEDADDPMVLKIDINDMTAIYLGATSETLPLNELSDELDDNIVSKLEKIDGVASVKLTGDVENVVNITVNPEKLEGYGISTAQITNALNAENLNLPSGEIEEGSLNMQVRTIGEFKSVDEIKNLPISTSGGSIIRMQDIATVEETTKEETSYTLVNGERSVVIVIQKQSNANIVDVSEKVAKEMASIAKEYKDVNLTVLSDTSDYITKSVSNVFSTAIQAAIMAIIVLFVFLRSGRTSAIIAVSIPTSIIVTFAAMYAAGMTLNIISLGGITIGVGMLVDNSVVILENIYKHHSKGEPAIVAAEVGAREMGLSVMASTLTTVAVFIPLMFVQGTIGQLFKDLSLTVCFSLIASLVVSLTFVPMACSKLLDYEDHKTKKSTGLLNKFLDSWGQGLDKIDSAYRRVLVWALRHKKKVLISVFAIFIVSLGLFPLVGLDLMSSMDQGMASVSIEMPKGTKLEETSKTVDEVLSKISDIPETELYYVMVGSSTSYFGGDSSDQATITLDFVDKKDRNRSTEEIVLDITDRLKGIAGADIEVSASESAMGSYSSSSDVEVELLGDDSKVLRNIGDDLVNIISEKEWARDVTSSSEDALPEASISINRERAAMYGVSTSTIASAVSTAVTGSTVTQYKVDGDEIDVVLKQDDDRISHLNDLQKITITTATGQILPLTEFVNIDLTEGYSSITRKNQRKYITLGANLVNMDSGTAQKELTTILDSYNFPDGYSYQFSGDLETMMETFTSFIYAIIIALILVYMIMAAQFESFIYPFLVMFSVPLGITGAVLGLFLTGNTITSTAFMGFIMLVGTVVNNAIVLIDYTNQLRQKGMSCNEALIESGPNRLRPILMTTLTTVIGMVPTALATAEGTEMQRPLAVAIIFGLSLSTLVTLIFIPVLYSSFEVLRMKTIKGKMQKRKERKNEKNNSEHKEIVE